MCVAVRIKKKTFECGCKGVCMAITLYVFYYGDMVLHSAILVTQYRLLFCMYTCVDV